MVLPSLSRRSSCSLPALKRGAEAFLEGRAWVRRSPNLRFRVGELTPGPHGEFRRNEVALSGDFEQRRLGVGHVDAPEVTHRRLHLKRIDAAELEAEGQGAVEGEFREGALAERVDGGDVGAVEILQGAGDAGAGRGLVDVHAAPAFDE